MVSASTQPNGTKYKSHPVPKVSTGSGRNLRKQPVNDKLYQSHTLKTLLHISPPPGSRT